MSLSICLLNYNSYSDTIQCIDSLMSQKTSNFSIIVVDNCSTDKSIEKITKHFDFANYKYSKYDYYNKIFECKTQINSLKVDIILIKNPLNNGFSAGNNLAMKFSKDFLSNEMILLLNVDTVVEADFIITLEAEFSKIKNKSKAPIALGVSEYSYFNKKKNHSGFNYINLLTGLAFTKPIFPCFKYICGACLMIDGDAPAMDESYFLYFEDADYSKVLINKGYTFYKTNKTRYYHKVGSCLKDNPKKAKYQFTSMWLFFKRYYRQYMYIVFTFRRIQYTLLNKRVTLNFLSETYKKQRNK